MVLIPVSCTMSQTSVHSSSALYLSDLVPYIYFSLPLYSHKGFDLGHTQMVSEKAMAPHSSTLAWKIPWVEEPGRL